MPRTYTASTGKRKYKAFIDSDLDKALADIRTGMSQQQASKKYKISRGTIQNHLKRSSTKRVGHPTTLSSDEGKIIVNTMLAVATWGYRLTTFDMKVMVKKYLDKKGVTIRYFKDNMPGDDFIYSFLRRNNVVSRVASNIKRSRASVTRKAVYEYFARIKDILENMEPSSVYNFGETNISDDPKCMKEVERVQEHSNMSLSIMACITASGELLPPFVVYRARNVYNNWITGGPSGTKYAATKNGWFETHSFERWFFEILLPHTQKTNGKKFVVGDNLGSHFSSEVINACQENNIYFTTLPPNSTHLTQPLDLAVFRPMKTKWAKILDNWRKESRITGCLPKEHFPGMLKKLWDNMSISQKTVQSAFRATGLVPFDPSKVLAKIPDEEISVGPILDHCLEEMLQEIRGQSNDVSKNTRGRKMIPAKALVSEESSHREDIDISRPSTSGLRDIINRTINIIDDNVCKICFCTWKTYKGPDWVQCITCRQWICGTFNRETETVSYECPSVWMTIRF